MFKYYLYKFGQFLTNRLPLSLSYKFARLISLCHYYCSASDRKAVSNNLRTICGTDKNINALTKEVFVNFGMYLVEFFRMGKMLDPRFIEQNVRIEHMDRLDQVLSKGKGAILLTAHLGNWEYGGVLLSKLGYPFTAVALPHKERPVNDLFNYQRESQGVTIVPTNIAVRKCLESLKENKLIALVGDRDFGNHGEVMDFLGRKAVIPKGAAIFSGKTGAPIIPIFLVRHKDGKFVLFLEDPIYPPVIEDWVEKENLFCVMKKYLVVIEQKIRQYPTQWLMFREFYVS